MYSFLVFALIRSDLFRFSGAIQARTREKKIAKNFVYNSRQLQNYKFLIQMRETLEKQFPIHLVQKDSSNSQSNRCQPQLDHNHQDALQ